MAVRNVLVARKSVTSAGAAVAVAVLLGREGKRGEDRRREEKRRENGLRAMGESVET